MKVYVINLDKNTKRMEHMSRQLGRLGIEYERIPAVYGAELSKEERRKCFSAFRSFCAEGYRMSPGAIGCALSHVKVYRKMMERDIACAVILEDDIQLSSDFREVADHVCKNIDIHRPQAVILSALGWRTGRCQDRTPTIVRTDNMLCTDGYVITLPAARLIEGANFPVVAVADKWRRWKRRLGVELFQLVQPVVSQNNAIFGSDINRFASRPDLARRAALSAWLTKPIRLVEVFVDYCIWRFCGR